MRTLLILAAFFIVGDCVEIVKGPFKGQYWTVVKMNTPYRFDIKQGAFTLKNVRASYLELSPDSENCK